jgi:hypothetical protein
VNVRLFVISISVACIATAANAAPKYPPDKIDLPSDTSHPDQDAKPALKRGEFALIGVYSYAYTIPGVEGYYRWSKFSGRIELKVIRGTSDAMQSNEDWKFNERARQYTGRYNRVLLKYFEAHHPDWLGPRER